MAMMGATVAIAVWGVLSLGMLVLFAYLIFLVIRALRVYISSKEVREERPGSSRVWERRCANFGFRTR